MSETSFLSDIILPDIVDIERFNFASSPSSLHPVAAIALPGIKPLGGQDVRMTLKAIIDAIDTDGSKKMKGYWAFKDPEGGVMKEVSATPELKGRYEDLTRDLRFPSYGRLDPKTRKIINEEGRPVKAEYGLYKKGGFKHPLKG